MKQAMLRGLTALLLTVAPAAFSATYTYTGNAFAIATNSYTTSDFVFGEFTTAAPLAPNLSAQDISGLVLTWTFSDGVTTLSQADGIFADFNLIPGISVSTDGAGDIIEWSIFARDVPLATAVSETNTLISTLNMPMAGVQDQGAEDAVCNTVDLVPNCTSYGAGTPGLGVNFSSPGSWVTTLPPPPPAEPEAIPGLTGYALALTGISLLLLGMGRLRRRT